MSPSRPPNHSEEPPAVEKRRDMPALMVLVVGLIILFGLAVIIILPFLAAMVTALVCATLMRPSYAWVLGRLKPSYAGLVAGLMCLALVLLVFLPLGWLGWIVVEQAQEGVQLVSKGVKDVAGRLQDYTWFKNMKESEWFKNYFEAVDEPFHALKSQEQESGPAQGTPQPVDPPGARPAAPEAKSDTEHPSEKKQQGQKQQGQRLQEAAATVATTLTRWAGRIFANLANLFMQFFLMLFLLFYFLKDGPQILASLKRAVPLDKRYQDRVVESFGLVTRSVIRGSVLTAVVQGVIAGVAFLFAGIPSIFWGVMVAISSLIPPLGTALVTVPLALVLGLTGSWGRAIYVMVVGVLIGVLDNLVRPYLMGKNLHMHQIWLLISILGALAAFGPMGILYGPLVLVLLGTFVAMFVREELGK